MKGQYDKTFFFREIVRVQKLLGHKSHHTEKIIASKQYIDQNYFEALPLDKLCREAMLSKFHFIRLFKSHYGRTPHQYLISVRIQQAKKMLSENNSVAETCAAVGFDSVTSFASLFKKMTGKSPLAFKTKKAILKSLV